MDFLADREVLSPEDKKRRRLASPSQKKSNEKKNILRMKDVFFKTIEKYNEKSFEPGIGNVINRY